MNHDAQTAALQQQLDEYGVTLLQLAETHEAHPELSLDDCVVWAFLEGHFAGQGEKDEVERLVRLTLLAAAIQGACPNLSEPAAASLARAGRLGSA